MDQSEFLANLGFLSILGFAAVGGLKGLEEKYFLAMASNRSRNSSCGFPREDAFHIFRDPVTSDLPWPGILFGMSIPSLWYWCTDQVQGSRLSPWNASLGCLEAGFLSFPYLFSYFSTALHLIWLFLLIWQIWSCCFLQRENLIHPAECLERPSKQKRWYILNGGFSWHWYYLLHKYCTSCLEVTGKQGHSVLVELTFFWQK